MARSLRAVGRWVLVEMLPVEEITTGGIVLSENWKTPSGRGTVLSVGDQATAKYPELKAGARVMFSWIDGAEVHFDGREIRRFDSDQIKMLEDL